MQVLIMTANTMILIHKEITEMGNMELVYQKGEL